MIHNKKISIALKAAVAMLLILGSYFFFGEKKEDLKHIDHHNDSIAKIRQKDSFQKGSELKLAGSAKNNNTVVQNSLKYDPRNPPEDPLEFEKWAVENLKQEFGDDINLKSRQAELLGFRKYLMAHYPQDWQLRLDDILSSAFPQEVDNILETFNQFDAYNQWFEDNASLMVSMGYENIKEQLIQKRVEIFGGDADSIWSPGSEIAFIEDVFFILDQAEDIPIEDQLYVFKSAVDDLNQADYKDFAAFETSESSEKLDQNRTYQMTTSFLNMDSVQSELQSMDADERADSLNQIRRQMGFDEATLETMAERDRKNEDRWQNGLAYMAKREELIRQYSGTQLDNRLNDLRRQYFRDEAQTIEAEEGANFFRYNRRRIYGRN